MDLNLDVIVKLVQAGSAGVAVICMLMSFGLLSQINKQPVSAESLPLLKEKNSAARWYMGFSTICLILAISGVYLQNQRQSHAKIQVNWNPDEKPRSITNADAIPKAIVFIGGKKQIYRSSEMIDFPDNGQITVDYNPLVEYYIGLLSGFFKVAQNGSREGGF